MRAATITLWCALVAAGQEPAAKQTWQNTGKPIHLAAACTAEQIRQLDLPCTATEPCPLYLELSSLESVAGRLLVVGNLHTSSLTLSSLLLATEDEGKTWTEPLARLTAAGLDRIQFFDHATGWISGELQQSPSRDPFLLLTADGGKTWRQRPIMNEPGLGSIEHFTFDSRTHGLLYLDRLRNTEEGTRYHLYETMTGGESWGLRQASSKPLTIPRSAPIANGWRIVTDASTKSYRIERQQAGNWLPIASFLVESGACRPAE